MNKNGPQIIQKPDVSQERQPGPTLDLYEDLLSTQSFSCLLARLPHSPFHACSPSSGDTNRQRTAKRQEQ